MPPVEPAQLVIGEHLDHPAFGDAAAAAFGDHALELGPQRLEPPQPALDLGELFARDGIRFGTGTLGLVDEGEEGADAVEAEPQLARVPYEAEALEVPLAVPPLPPRGPRSRRKQADALVVADRLRPGARGPGQIADAVAGAFHHGA